jgi:Tfp pilus assembly protein PilF
VNPEDQHPQEQLPPAHIDQTAGDHAIQIGQAESVNFPISITKSVVIILIFLTLVAAIIFYVYKAGQKPARMTGDFNIVVAQFGEVTDRGSVSSAQATQMSNRLFNFLDSTYKTTDFGQNIQVAHKNIGILTEDREAEQLAHDINANIIIYGDVFIKNNDATISPKFYVSERNKAGAIIVGEITGQHQLAAPIHFDISLANDQEQANNELRSRAAMLVHFTEGMVYYSAGNPNVAVHAFERALLISKQRGSHRGDEVLYFFLAEAYRVAGDFSRAATNVDQALILNPEYARAYILRGNIYYAQALPSWDQIGLDRALAAYKQALEVKYQPQGSYVTEKVNVALGNIYVIQGQQNGSATLFAQAIDHYSAVITEYDETRNESIRELSALAYFGLGAAYERQSNAAKAIESYQRCFDLSNDSELKSRAMQHLDIVKKGHN